MGVPGFQVSTGVWVGESAEVHPDAIVEGPALIGDNTRVQAGARLGPYTVLGQNVRVRSGADLERCVVHDNTYLGENTRLRGTIVGRACDLRRGARVDEGSVLGDECFIAEEAFIGTDVKIYPFKTVEANAVINSSIVWESKGARSLFGRDGVGGLANVDVTAELAVRLAMAYGSTLKAGSTIVTSRDSSRSARMLKRAMMAGLNASGVNVVDLETSSVPVTRFLIRQRSAAGGLTVRIMDGDPQSVIIRFFDTYGADLSEDGQRKIERIFHREDFRRVLPGEMGDIDFPPRALEQYATAVEATIDLALHPRGPLQGGGRLLLRVRRHGDAQHVGQARRRGARGEPVRVDVGFDRLRPRARTTSRWRRWCAARGPRRCSDRPRRRTRQLRRRQRPGAQRHAGVAVLCRTGR